VKKYFLLFFLLMLLCPAACADGMSFLGDGDMMMLQPEEEQAGAIFYENGYENLLLSVSLDWSSRGNQSVWIFPVPAKPETVTIDILRGFPTYGGNSVSENYYERIWLVTLASASYATFPITTPLLMICASGTRSSGLGFAGAAPPGYNDVLVHDSVENMGIRTELVTAKNAGALSAYLSGRGLLLPNDSLSMLDGYIGQDYSFVITSVENVTEYHEQFPATPQTIQGHYITGSNSDNVLGVSVRFPTSRIYFPLLPTRAYGDREIPLILTVNGHVTPRIPDGVKLYHVDYMQDPSYEPPSRLNNFYNHHEVVHPWPYTKIRIYGPAGNYNDDLWIDTEIPPDIPRQVMITQFYPLIGAGLYILFSVISALVAGLLVFRKGSLPCRKLLLHGLWNCTTIIGFVWATRNILALPEEESGKRGRFVLVFYLVFLILLAAVMIMLVPVIVPIIIMVPFILLMYIVFGATTVAKTAFTFITGHDAYMPHDGMTIWCITLIICILLAAYCIIAIRITRGYLGEK
jgi:hypothetical protein